MERKVSARDVVHELAVEGRRLLHEAPKTDLKGQTPKTGGFAPRKWEVPESVFVNLSLQRTLSSEELAKVNEKLHEWTKQRAELIVQLSSSEFYGQEILILNLSRLNESQLKKQKKAHAAAAPGDPDSNA
jgi:hypothetical protein